MLPLPRPGTPGARAAPGVALVLTGADFPVSYGIMPVSQDEHALCRDKVRYVGDPVAAVVAASFSPYGGVVVAK